MSGIYNEIQDGSYNEVLSRRFGMKISAPAPALVPEVGAGIVVENDRFEWGFLKRENAYSVAAFVGAVVGQKSVLCLSNFSTSAIATVNSFRLNVAGDIFFGRASILGAIGGAATLPRANDFRNRQSSLIAVTNQTVVGDPAVDGTMGIIATTGWQPLDIVIAPRTELVFWNFGTNLPLSIMLTWKERAVSASELG